MIQKITISNFFSIREPLEVSFEASKEKQYGEDWVVQIGHTRLLKTVLLYGANGSGKTNILCALDFLRYLVVNIPPSSDSTFSYMRFAFDASCKEKETTFDLFFFIGQTRYRYCVSLTPEMICSEELRVFLNGNSSKKIYSREYDVEKGINIVKFGNWFNLSSKDKKTIEESTTNNVTVLSSYASRNLSCPELTKVRNYFKNNFFKLYSVDNHSLEVAKAIKDSPNLKNLLVDLMRTFHSNIVDIRVEEEVHQIPEEAKQMLLQLKTSESEREEIMRMKTMRTLTGQYIHRTELGEFSLDDASQSDGTRSFIAHLVLFYKAIRENRLVALDEFGEGMQAKTQHLLLDFFLKFSGPSQLIFATQSLGMLDFPRMRRDAIQIVSKDNLGQTHLDATTVRGIHKNIKLRKAYLDGKFTSIDPNEPDIDFGKDYEKYKALIWGDLIDNYVFIN